MTRQAYIILIGLTLFLSCKNDKTKTFDNTLVGEWALDSISGLFNKWDKDFVYITDSGAFWKFTYWNDKYLIDSSLTIRGNEVYSDKKKNYQIQLLDSFNLTVTDNYGNKFFYSNQDKIWKSDYKSDLRQFISSHSTHQLLCGWWKLTQATFRPMKLVNYPDDITDFTMHLNKNGVATILINDLIDSTIDYSWKADSMALSLSRGCIAGSEEQIILLDKNRLTLVLQTVKDYMPTKDTLEFTRCKPLTE
jgi:hypothetical protein